MSRFGQKRGKFEFLSVAGAFVPEHLEKWWKTNAFPLLDRGVDLARWLRYLESPIEELMLVSLLTTRFSRAIQWFSFESSGVPLRELVDAEVGDLQLGLAGQVLVDRYRVDFALRIGRGRLIAIECDGHEFHQRDREQVQRDYQRDRRILQAGVPVLRFSGTEIWNRPMDCAMEISDYVATLLAPIARSTRLPKEDSE